MSTSNCATRVIGAALGSNLVVSTGSVKIYGIHLGENADPHADKGAVTFQDNDGNTLFVLMAGQKAPVTVETIFLADNGFTVVASSADIYCTVWYSYDGA
jgi:hypothetical protein